MPFSEVFSDFTDSDDFGTAATYNGQTIYGIFDQEYSEPGEVETSQPMFGCAASDVSGVSNSSQITINSVLYDVHNVQPDGTGWVTLYLHET